MLKSVKTFVLAKPDTWFDAFIINTDRSIRKTYPANGKHFELEEMQKIVGGYIEMVQVSDQYVLICNEDGIALKLPHNEDATWVHGGMGLLGNVLICRRSLLE